MKSYLQNVRYSVNINKYLDIRLRGNNVFTRLMHVFAIKESSDFRPRGIKGLLFLSLSICW